MIADRAETRAEAGAATEVLVRVRSDDEVGAVRHAVGAQLTRRDPRHAVVLGCGAEPVRQGLAVGRGPRRERRRRNGHDLMAQPPAEAVGVRAELLLPGDQEPHAASRRSPRNRKPCTARKWPP